MRNVLLDKEIFLSKCSVELLLKDGFPLKDGSNSFTLRELQRFSVNVIRFDGPSFSRVYRRGFTRISFLTKKHGYSIARISLNLDIPENEIVSGLSITGTFCLQDFNDVENIIQRFDICLGLSSL